MRRLILGLGVVVLGTAVAAAEPLKSGPQVGQPVPGPFHPLNVTGANAGKKHCLFCENGARPVAVVFARKVTPAVTALVKKIDTATAQNAKAELASFVVFLSDEESLNTKLVNLAKKEKIQQTILSIDNPAGPGRYKISQDADVTVIFYEDFTVRANHSFRQGELNDKAITQVVNHITRMLAK